MAQRGRKSKADLAIVNETSAVERPIPPVDLRVEQKNEWLTLVNSHAADYFGPETLPLLESYSYLDLKTNVGLTDADFDTKNPEYNFP